MGLKPSSPCHTSNALTHSYLLCPLLSISPIPTPLVFTLPAPYRARLSWFTCIPKLTASFGAERWPGQGMECIQPGERDGLHLVVAHTLTHRHQPPQQSPELCQAVKIMLPISCTSLSGDPIRLCNRNSRSSAFLQDYWVTHSACGCVSSVL